MSLPIREQILQALATRVSAARGLEGFDVRDARESVDGTITVLVDQPDTAENTNYGTTHISMPVTIGRVRYLDTNKGDEWHTQGSTLQADLSLQAFGGDDTLGGLADGMDYTGGQVDVITDGSRGIAAQINITVRYHHVRGNPYLIDEE